MKKILILSYFYPPCNVTANNRPVSFAKGFKKAGYSVDIVTRQWTGKEKNWNDYFMSDNLNNLTKKKEDGIQIHYLPYSTFNYWLYPFSKIQTFIQFLKGNFNYELKFHQFHPYLQELCKQQKFDFILVTSPPLTVLKTGWRLSKEFEIPLITDFRDFENELLLFKKPKENLKNIVRHKLLMPQVKKWLSKSVITFTASPPITAYIKNYTGFPVFTVNNGFSEFFLRMNEPYSDIFTLTVTGTLYKEANINFFISTLKTFLKNNEGEKIKINFVGQNANLEVSKLIAAELPADKINITDRISQNESAKIASSSHVLLLAGFDKLKGAYTSKIFEYLGLRRNILQLPGDSDVVEELLKETNAGKYPHTIEEAVFYLQSWLNEWLCSNQLNYYGNIKEIKKYQREEQIKKIIKLANEL